VFGGGAGAEECGGWGYGGVEVVVGRGRGGEGGADGIGGAGVGFGVAKCWRHMLQWLRSGV